MASPLDWDVRKFIFAELKKRGFKRLKPLVYGGQGDRVLSVVAVYRSYFGPQCLVDCGVIHVDQEDADIKYSLTWTVSARLEQFYRFTDMEWPEPMDYFDERKPMEDELRQRKLIELIDAMDTEFKTHWENEEWLKEQAHHPTRDWPILRHKF